MVVVDALGRSRLDSNDESYTTTSTDTDEFIFRRQWTGIVYDRYCNATVNSNDHSEDCISIALIVVN